MPALGLHLRGQEFVVAVKCRIGLPIFNSAGKCPACNKDSDKLGDHALVCAFGGERIARHNSLRDALHSTAAEAGLAPMKEGRALLPGTDKRPADIFIPHWAGGLDAALDVTVTHPLQDQDLQQPWDQCGRAGSSYQVQIGDLQMSLFQTGQKALTLPMM